MQLARARARAGRTRSLASTTIERPSGVSSARLDSWAASASAAGRDAGDREELGGLPVAEGDGAGLVQQQRVRRRRPPRPPGRTWPARCAAPAGPCRRCRSRTAARRSWSGSGRPAATTSTMPVTPSPLSASVSGAAGCWALAKIANGCRVTTASRKMIVSAASRMFSAISFGVFCRLAPSTRAIIRSMKLSPGFWVIRTTIRSESTFVPPVTAQRSPPDSRITGADSPVIADSSTLAMPSTTSPSPGMISPGLDDDDVAELQLGGRRPAPRAGRRRRRRPADSRRATVSVLAARRVSAWALPRPSATASARLAKTTVSHSQTVIAQANTRRVGDGEDGGEDRADLDDEHDRVAPQGARVELAQRVRQRAASSCCGSSSRRPRRSGGSRRRGAGRAECRSVVVDI